MSATECSPQAGTNSDGWVKPSDVMRNRRIKRAAIHARLNNSQPLQILVPEKQKKAESNPPPHRNPFRDPVNKKRRISDSVELQNNYVIDLFKHTQTATPSLSIQKSQGSSSKQAQSSTVENTKEQSGTLHVGWRLNFKATFYSDKPIPWKKTFKASERAAGITGFARCLHSGKETGTTIDSSINARFYQNCQVWQFPNLPGVNVFPREKDKVTTQTGIYSSPEIASELNMIWGEALWSLFSELRVRQCAYFYMLTSAFTCVFRAAGLGGFPHVHAFVTPTTSGFREAMTKDGVDFTMPLNTPKKTVELDDDLEVDDAHHPDKESMETEAFLADLGIDSSSLPSYNSKNRKSKQNHSFEGCGSSLVCVEDMELSGFVNFLLNCKSCTTNTGLLAGVPPTLLAPVAFTGGSLRALKVSTPCAPVRTPSGNMRYIVDVVGPILPTTLLQFCEQLKSTNESFEVSVASVESTLPLCLVASKEPAVPLAFATENLVDCGLSANSCEAMCQEPAEHRSKLLAMSREIQYRNSTYTWTK